MARYSSRKKFGYRGKRGSVSSGRRRSYTKTARRTGYRLKARFATVGYKRDVEKKYIDQATTEASKQLKYKAMGVCSAENSGSPTGGWQDMLKGVPQGVDTKSRVGNVIDVKYVKGKIMLVANTINNSITSSENAQNGEAALDNSGVDLKQFLRTTYRVAIVRDMQVNSVATGIAWSDVFQSQYGLGSPANFFGDVMGELNVANMGRFRVLMDRTVELDATDPQKVISFMIRNVGKVRYNGPEASGGSPALTDSGLYLVWAVQSYGEPGIHSTGSNSGIFTSDVVATRRLCFSDA